MAHMEKLKEINYLDTIFNKALLLDTDFLEYLQDINNLKDKNDKNH